MSDRTESILEKYLDGDFRVFPMSDAPCVEEDLREVSRRVGVHFPSDYQSHVLGRFPGIYIEVKEDVWPRPRAFEVGPFWSFLYAVHTFTPNQGAPDWMRLDRAAEVFQADTGLIAAPVLKIVGDPSVFCVDLSGGLCRFDVDTGTLRALDTTFWQLFEDEVREIKGRKDKKLQGIDQSQSTDISDSAH